MVERYAEVLATWDYQRHTQRRMLQHIRHFVRWLGEEDLRKVNVDRVERYIVVITKSGIAVKTVQNHLSSLKGFFDWLLMHGYVAKHPLQCGLGRRVPEKVPVYLPDDDVELLLSLARQESIWVEVVTALNTGLRMDELRHLRWADVDLDRKQRIVQGEHAKGKRPRTVPLNSKALDALRQQHQLYPAMSYVFPGGQGGKHNRNLWTRNTMRS